MRMLIQLLVAAMVFGSVVYLLTRRRQQSPADADQDHSPGSDTGAFLIILVVSAVVALGAALLLHSFWE